MRIDMVLAITLILAISESWEKNISTGIQHLRVFEVLIGQIIALQQCSVLQGSDLA